MIFELVFLTVGVHILRHADSRGGNFIPPSVQDYDNDNNRRSYMSPAERRSFNRQYAPAVAKRRPMSSADMAYEYERFMRALERDRLRRRILENRFS